MSLINTIRVEDYAKPNTPAKIGRPRVTRQRRTPTPDEIDQQRCYTVWQFCREFNIGRSSVYRAFDEGKLKRLKIGKHVRIDKQEAERWYASLGED
ncbi:MAG: excisionase family DNA-binding protein [Rhodospirillaceae bacterium]